MYRILIDYFLIYPNKSQLHGRISLLLPADNFILRAMSSDELLTELKFQSVCGKDKLVLFASLHGP